jgi:hypothetical protein
MLLPLLLSLLNATKGVMDEPQNHKNRKDQLSKQFRALRFTSRASLFPHRPFLLNGEIQRDFRTMEFLSNSAALENCEIPRVEFYPD